MEVMEDGNLMDKVNILLQRDLGYYTSKQSILQEPICAGVAGGKLDFPQYASFAAIKIVLWWEDEFVAGFLKESGLIPKTEKMVQSSNASTPIKNPLMVKSSDPSKFITSVAKSSEQLLEHLHTLTQEALDHADLNVLVGTIGAACLIRNCLWFYIQSFTENSKHYQVELLQTAFKQYQEMGEALAERLLDMHCRLVSLYILQDAESLDWENLKPFFESERGSYVIQMWWLYMKGTRDNLWKTVPPKMAQNVFAGLLNESLTILTVRYTQSIPSNTRSKLLLVDISNLLLCIGQLLPSICYTVDEVIGLNLNNQTKTIRDIHSKCQELLVTLLLRGTPLDTLNKVFKKGVDSVEILKSRGLGLSPWITIGLPHIFSTYPKQVVNLNDLDADAAIALSLSVMLAQPQPNWSLLLKVLAMREGKIISMLFNLAIKSSTIIAYKKSEKPGKCERFLCARNGSCQLKVFQSLLCSKNDYNELVESLTLIIIRIGNNENVMKVLVNVIDDQKDWAECFDRRQVWNLNYPPWYRAIINLARPTANKIVPIVVHAVQTGASMYQAMKIFLISLMQLWNCIDLVIFHIGVLLQESLPSNITPVGNSAIIQILVAAFYYELTVLAEESTHEMQEHTVKFSKDTKSSPLTNLSKFEHSSSTSSSLDVVNIPTDTIALTIAEALCSIDEDNKHTDEIEILLEQVKETLQESGEITSNEGFKRVEQSVQMTEVLVSELLATTEGKRSLKILYHFITNNSENLLNIFGVKSETKDVNYTPINRAQPCGEPLLHTMFHIGLRSFDQLLTGEWVPDWASMYNIPMGLNIDRIWTQVARRPEFRDVNHASLSPHNARIVTNLINLLKQT